MYCTIMLLCAITVADRLPDSESVTVASRDELARAIRTARPGTTILIKPGTYAGGISGSNLQGTQEQPIIIRAADPARPPAIQNGATGIMLSKVAHIQIHDIRFEKLSGNGLNIDDGGDLEHPSHHVVLKGLQIGEIGPNGNHDGIKLSGVDDFKVEDCTIERWGGNGSGIDMVGCHRGEIVGCRFRHGDTTGDNAVQTKGGSSNIAIRRCRFDHAGQRAINIGGSTGLSFFRPRPLGYEAADISVEDCTFIGSTAPIAFVGVDRALVQHNTFYLPKRWAVRVLQETRVPGFVPCRNGRFLDNLIVFRGSEMAQAVNTSDAIDIASFEFARNAWYCLDAPSRSKPRLPIAEKDGLYGVEPRFRDAAKGDLHILPNSPTQGAGVRPES